MDILCHIVFLPDSSMGLIPVGHFVRK